MRAAIQDRLTLRALRPLEIAQYLRAQGWHRVETIPNRFSVWTTSEDSEPAELLLPVSQDTADYHYRISEVLAEIEKRERRSQLEILQSLEFAKYDVTRFRLRSPDGEDGTVQLREAANKVPAVLEVMLAAACSTLHRGAYFPTRKPQEAVDYIGKLRLGQSERGSYVLTVLSQVPPAMTPADEGHLVPMPEPYPRRVVQTLNHGMGSVVAAVSEGVVTAFESQIPNGVSANLCLALAELGKTSQGFMGVEVGIDWAPTRPPESSGPNRFDLPPDALPIIEEAGRVLKQKAPIDEYDIIGPVISLHREEGAESGIVTVLGFVEAGARRVRMQLPGVDYDKMVDAHKEKKLVMVTGDLVYTSNRYELRSPRNIAALPDDSSDEQ